MKNYDLVYYVDCRDVVNVERIDSLKCESNEEVIKGIVEKYNNEEGDCWGMVEGDREGKVFGISLYEESGVVVIREDSVLYDNFNREDINGMFNKVMLSGVLGMVIDVGCK
jgi:hypothetical protein